MDPRLRQQARRSRWSLKSGEGAYVADAATLARLESGGQVVARYAGGNPNGSARDIAGVHERGGERGRASCRTPSTRSTR